MDLITRIKERKTINPTFTFEFGGITFEVARYSEVEDYANYIRVTEDMAKKGISEDTPEGRRLSTVMHCDLLLKSLGKHCKSVKAEGLDEKAKIGDVLDVLSVDERFRLAAALRTAKNGVPEGNVVTPHSEKDFEQDLKTRSERVQ